jgi:hypothetical protein
MQISVRDSETCSLSDKGPAARWAAVRTGELVHRGVGWSRDHQIPERRATGNERCCQTGQIFVPQSEMSGRKEPEAGVWCPVHGKGSNDVDRVAAALHHAGGKDRRGKS